LGLHGIKKDFRKEIASSETKFYKSSLRSGQRIEFEGSVVILGDVNAGAEVIAEDNIVVLGSLRGMAHAGAKGNQQAIIASRIIDSPQIRIGSIIKERNREEIDMQAFSYAYVGENDEIVME
jgi:septum site-determining protein MinC